MTARLLLAALLLLAGCRSGPRKKVIGVVPKATSHLFWVSVQQGAFAAGRELGVDVVWNGPTSETEYARQIQIVDSLVAQRVDGLAVAATERKALVPPIDRAMKAGIPVTIFDSGLDSTNYTTYVATNNFKAGQMGAHALAKLLGGRGQVAVLMHAPGSVSTTEREQGFEDVIAREYPGIRIVARQFGMSSRAKSREAAENFLTAHPDLDGLFCSTEPSSSGAALALKSRRAAGKVKFVAFDSADNMIQDLKDGIIHAMVVQDPYKIGYEAVRTLVDTLNKKPPPKQMQLDATVVTKADLDKPEIKALLFPDFGKPPTR
jgi:ribose transport system substrate-binding protein